jgi:Immunoglobulin I-set domain
LQKVLWNKDGELLGDDDQFQIETVLDGPTVWSRLTIVDAQLSDAGTYGITVKNDASDATMVSTLVVNG